MNNKIDNIIENLKALTLLEAAELVRQIEEVFEVDTSSIANTSMITMHAENQNNTLEKVEEKTEFDIVLNEVPTPKKIAILKVVRSLTALGLKEAKELVESTPKVIKNNISKEEAEEIKQKLEEAGAKVSIT